MRLVLESLSSKVHGYGKKDEGCVTAVKKLFRELDLNKDFDLELESKEEIEEILASIVEASKGTWGEKCLGPSFVITMRTLVSAYKQNHSILLNLC